MDFVFDWITRYGYLGLFSLLVLGIVGLPVPDETLLTFAGYLIYSGRLKPVPTGLAALFGTMCGITLSYTVGRLTGYWLIEKYGAKVHITMERVERIHHWFQRLGRFALTLGYFIPGVRHLTAFVAGASKLETPMFALFAYAGAVLWVASFLSLGYYLGEKWTEASARIHDLLLIAGGVVVAAAVVYWLWRKKKRPTA